MHATQKHTIMTKRLQFNPNYMNTSYAASLAFGGLEMC
jgi:hypothetical protein